MKMDVNPQHSLDLPIVLGNTLTLALWAHMLYVHSTRWMKIAEVQVAPAAAPPFQSSAMDVDCSMDADFSMSRTASPKYFVPDMDVDGQVPPPGPPPAPARPAGPHIFTLSNNHTTPFISVPFTPSALDTEQPVPISLFSGLGTAPKTLPTVMAPSPFTRSRSPFVDVRHPTTPTIHVDPLMARPRE